MGLLRNLIRELLGDIRSARDARKAERRAGRRGAEHPVQASPVAGPDVMNEVPPPPPPPPASQEAQEGGAAPRQGLVGKVLDGVQKLRQEGGLYAEGEEPLPEMDVEKSAGSDKMAPANQLSKKRCYFGFLLMGFLLASDWMATLVSIQALYYLLQGPKRLFGLTFSVYDLAALFSTVFFSAWATKTNSYKAPVLLGALLSMAGNFVYAFTVLANRWWVVLIARAVSGLGSGAIYLGTPYWDATTASRDENDFKDVRYKAFQSAGQQILMLVGMIFLKVNTVNEDSSTGTKLFNFYTLQGWLLALLILLVAVPFWLWLFQDPTEQNEHLAKKEEEVTKEATPEDRARVNSLGSMFLLSAFITIFAMVGFLSNLFALAAGQYKIVEEQKELFNPFLPVGLGGLGAGFVYKAAIGKTKRKLPVPPAVADERFLLVLTNWLLFAAWMLTIPWCGKTCKPAPALFYTAAACVGVVSTLWVLSMGIFLKHKKTQYAAVMKAGAAPFKMLGPVLLAAKFLGPLVVASVTFMATPSGEVNVCTGTVQNDLCLDAPPEEQCIVLGDKYYVQGCTLYNAIYLYPIMAGVCLLNSLLMMAIMAKHSRYS